MIPASPGFQPDRPGSPAFQRAQDGGFDTLTPAAVADLALVVTLDAPSRFAALGPYHAAVADLQIVVEFSIVTRGPRPSVPPGGSGVRRAVRTLPMRWRVATNVEIVVTLDTRTTGRDYLRDVILPDDEEVLALLVASTACRPAPRPAMPRAILAEILAEDDALGRR